MVFTSFLRARLSCLSSFVAVPTKSFFFFFLPFVSVLNPEPIREPFFNSFREPCSNSSRRFNLISLVAVPGNFCLLFFFTLLGTVSDTIFVLSLGFSSAGDGDIEGSDNDVRINEHCDADGDADATDENDDPGESGGELIMTESPGPSTTPCACTGQ